MKNKITVLCALLLLFVVGLGCGLLDRAPGSNGGAGNTAGTQPANTSDANIAAAKTGIPECDAALDLIARDQASADEGFIASKAREYIVDFVKESIKKSIEENQGDREKITRDCRKIKEDYEKQMAEKKQKAENNQSSENNQNK